MIQSLYSAASGLYAQQRNLDVVANNLANIETNGFKRSRADFKDAIYSQYQQLVPRDQPANMQYGNGVKLAQITKMFTASPMQETHNQLDVALVGDGFFSYRNANGELMYTREGSFKLSEITTDGRSYLVNGAGYLILDDTGNPIALPTEGDTANLGDDAAGEAGDNQASRYVNLANLAIRTDGSIYYGRNRIAKLGVYSFQNQEGLTSVGNNAFVPSENSGEAQLIQFPDVRQGFLEASNVDLAEEMSRMIRAQRAYQLASRAIKVADEMEQGANSLRS